MLASLKERDKLPLEAQKAAELLNKYEDGATKDEFKEDVREDKTLNEECTEKYIRMLRMTDNVNVEDNKAKLIEDEYSCSGFKTNALEQQERMAQKEHSKTLADLRKESEES